jgi:hypothetical protein
MRLATVAAVVLAALALPRETCAQDRPAIRTATGAPKARAALQIPGLDWSHQTTRNAEIYVLKGSRAERWARTLPSIVERAIAADLLWLNEPAPGHRLNLFFVGTPKELALLVGSGVGNFSATGEGTAFMIADTLAPPIRHEIMHLLSWRFWGPPASTWLSEGVATLAAGGCGGYTVDELVAAIRHDGMIVPLDSLWHRFPQYGEPGLIAYMEAASLIGFVDRTFGRKALRRLWAPGADGEVRQRIGVDLPTLETQWRMAIAQREPTVSWATIWRATIARGCEIDIAWPPSPPR